MRVERTQQNFGRFIKTSEATEYINRLPYAQRTQIGIYETASQNNPIATCISYEKGKIKVGVGPKTFVPNYFCNVVKTIKKGYKYAKALYEKQEAERSLTKDMNIPRIY